MRDRLSCVRKHRFKSLQVTATPPVGLPNQISLTGGVSYRGGIRYYHNLFSLSQSFDYCKIKVGLLLGATQNGEVRSGPPRGLPWHCYLTDGTNADLRTFVSRYF